jgi:pyruvate/2-oxoglutarate dehydrogenase complex dihydrolipoamide acyltransferase (E2) component
MKVNEVTHEEARDPRRESRRRFTKSVAAAVALAPLAHSFAARAQTPPATKEPAAPPNPQPSPSPQQPQPPSPLALAYAEVARLRFGDKINDEELVRVRRGIGNKLRTADALRNAKLKNSDEPDFVFSA